MPGYNYICRACETKLTKAKGEQLTFDETGQAIFEVTHGMFPKEEELAQIKCPNCKSKKVEKTLYGSDIRGYVAGSGILDVAGCRREMLIHTATRKDEETGKPLDPYHHMREVGEVDDLALRIKRSKLPKPKHFDNNPCKDPPKSKMRKKIS